MIILVTSLIYYNSITVLPPTSVFSINGCDRHFNKASKHTVHNFPSFRSEMCTTHM